MAKPACLGPWLVKFFQACQCPQHLLSLITARSSRQGRKIFKFSEGAAFRQAPNRINTKPYNTSLEPAPTSAEVRVWAGGLPTTRSNIHLTTQVRQSRSSVTHHNFSCMAAPMEEVWFRLNHVPSAQCNPDVKHEGKHLLVQSLRHRWDQCARRAAFWVAWLCKRFCSAPSVQFLVFVVKACPCWAMPCCHGPIGCWQVAPAPQPLARKNCRKLTI